MLDPNALAAIRLSIELSILATLILLVAGTPVAWWIARGRSRWRVPVRMPCRLASLLAARQQVVVAMTGMTATGLPRR